MPASTERRGVALEQVAVRGDRKIADALDPRSIETRYGKVLAGERLAAGQAHVLDTKIGEDPHQALDLFEGEDVGAIEPLHALGRHAVATAEVATVGDRHPQVRNDPAVGVFEQIRHNPSLTADSILSVGPRYPRNGADTRTPTYFFT